MPAVTKGKVLVTGANGYIALWVVKALLDQGYAVTVISDKWASLEDRITSQIAGALYAS